MKIISTFLVVFGLIFILIGTVFTAAAPLMIPGGGGGGGTYDYTWSLAGTAHSSASSVNQYQTDDITATVIGYDSSSGQATVMEWVVNNVVYKSIPVSGTGVYTFDYKPETSGLKSWKIIYLGVESSTIGTSYYTFSSGTITVNQVITSPEITSISSSSNPSETGQLVTFDASVSWGGQTGTLTWYVDGNAISGNSYTFNTAGTYTIEAYVQNSAGSNSKTMSQLVEIPVTSPPPSSNTTSTNTTSPPPSSNTTSTNTTTNTTNNNGALKNVGSFYYSIGDSQVAEMTNSLNYTYSMTGTSVEYAFYYVFTNGETENAKSYYLSIYNLENGSTSQIQIWPTNVTKIDGYSAIYVLGSFTVGQYKVTGFVAPSDGNPAINTVTSQINVHVNVPSNHKPNYILVSIGVGMIIIAIAFWRRLP